MLYNVHTFTYMTKYKQYVHIHMLCYFVHVGNITLHRSKIGEWEDSQKKNVLKRCNAYYDTDDDTDDCDDDGVAFVEVNVVGGGGGMVVSKNKKT